MFVPLWLIGLVAVVMLWLAARAFRPRGGEMVERQRRAAPPAQAELSAVLALPEVRDALAGGHKIEAIRIVRERTGLGLKEAKDLIESAEPGG